MRSPSDILGLAATRPSLLASDQPQTARFAAALALLLVLLHADVVLGGATFYMRDFGNYGLPAAHLLRDSLLRGEIPLWNPWSHLGIPFLAQWNTLCLYPPAWILVALPEAWGLSVFSLAHLVLAGAGLYRLAWCWTRHPAASALAGVAYALSGLALQSVIWPSVAATVAWAPWVILLVGRAIRLGGVQIPIAALAAAAQLLTGTPEFIAGTWLMIGVQHLLSPPRSGSVVLAAARLLITVALSAALSAAQLLPFFKLLSLSQRMEGPSAVHWAIPPLGWAHFFLPLHGMVQSNSGTWFQPDQQWTASYSLGILTLTLAAAAPILLRNRRAGALALLALLGVALGMGRNTLLFPAAQTLLPQLAWMQFPVKFVFLTTLSVPLLAALAYAHIDRERRLPGPRPALRVFIGTAIVASSLLAFALVHHLQHQPPSAPSAGASIPLRNATLRFGVLLAGTLLLIRSVRRPMPAPSRDRSLAFATLALVALDSLTQLPRPPGSVPATVFTAAITRDVSAPTLGRDRAHVSAHARRILRESRLTDPMAALTIKRLTLVHNANLLEPIPKVDGFFPLVPARSDNLLALIDHFQAHPPEPLLDLFCVSAVQSPTNFLVWTPRPTPPAWISAGQQAVFLNEMDAYKALVSPNFNPRAHVLLPFEAQAGMGATTRSAPTVNLISAQPHSLTAEIRATQPAWVIHHQTWYPDWTATVDGQPARNWQANYGFQAVLVPAGTHLVRWSYHDRAFRFGAIVSFTACLALVPMLRYKRPRREPNRMPS